MLTPEIVFWVAVGLPICLAIGMLKYNWLQDAQIEALRLENIELKDRIRVLEKMESL